MTGLLTGRAILARPGGAEPVVSPDGFRTTETYDAKVNTDPVPAPFDKIGLGILVTHSQSGGLAAIKFAGTLQKQWGRLCTDEINRR